VALAVPRRPLEVPRVGRLPAHVTRLPLGPLAAGLVVALVAGGHAAPAAGGLAFSVCLGAALLVRSWERPASHLPVLRLLYPGVAPALALTGLLALDLAAADDDAGVEDWLLACIVAAAVTLLVERHASFASRRSRIAFVGDAEAACRLATDLERSRMSSFVLAGRIATSGDRERDGDVRVIGELRELRAALVRERIDVIVMGSRVARLTIFDELAETCLDLPIQLAELATFYEDVFGHVPTAEINAAWFAHLVDANARHPSPRAKRTLDVALAVGLGMLTLPIMGLLALLVRRDGGPAIFAQQRIGEGGRPFRLYKLRTMQVGSGDEAAWAKEDDPRATGSGRFLRRTHLDELPQLWNVLRGEMSFVGPRPEQLEFVERLERTLPFYRRRHLTRPGLTGWAQVRCGYAGSEVGAAWKLCNDLYYVKHRSFGLDLLLLAETAGLIVFGGPTAATEARSAPWAGTGLPPQQEFVEPPPAPTSPPSAELPVVMAGSAVGHDIARGPAE
jgi:exopolysaccharide biosynthesis polyprenyl glycosylphosphotransferase